MDSSLESGLFEVAETATAAEHLRFDYTPLGQFLSNFVGFLGGASHVTERNGHLEGGEEGTRLIFVEFESAHGQSRVVHEGSINGLSCVPIKHHFLNFVSLFSSFSTDSDLIYIYTHTL